MPLRSPVRPKSDVTSAGPPDRLLRSSHVLPLTTPANALLGWPTTATLAAGGVANRVTTKRTAQTGRARIAAPCPRRALRRRRIAVEGSSGSLLPPSPGPPSLKPLQES